MHRKRSVVITTITDLMAKVRSTYDRAASLKEAQFIKYLSGVDLLILDELGVQRFTDHELVMISTIIDNRYINEKPTGILTNLTTEKLTDVLGQRVLERIMENGDWVAFNWESYRKEHTK